VHGDEEGQVQGLVGGEVEIVCPPAADQGGDEDAVAEAGDGEQFVTPCSSPTTMASG
jgi:hypothetical protein